MITEDGTVKLIDFGLAEWASGEIEHEAGSPYFYAPETILNKSVAQSDIWGLTVCMYKMLTAEFPFDADNKEQLLVKIATGKYNTDSDAFRSLSVECRDLISKLLVVDPKVRLTGIAALKHPFFKPALPSLPSVSMKVIKRLKSFKGVSILKREALNMLIKMSAMEGEFEGLSQAFQKIDKDGSGLITQDEL